MKTKIIWTVLAIGGLFLIVSIINNVGSETSEIKDGGQQESVLSIPGNLPAHIPMYPESVLRGVQENDNETERNTTLSLGTGDTVPDVISWYRGALSQNGWAVTGDRNVSGYILLEGENENIKVFIQAANHEDGLVVITQRIRIR